MTIMKKLAVGVVAAGALVAGLQSPASATIPVTCFGDEGAKAVKIYYHHTGCYANPGSFDDELYFTWRIESKNNKVKIDFVADNGKGARGTVTLNKNETWGNSSMQAPFVLVDKITIY